MNADGFDPLLHALTAAQRDAVTHVDGPLLILAGPGSGKTRVITHRIAYLIERGIRPRNILALTFTNKAADEMQARIERLAPGQQVWVGTFHRFCARLLREHAPLVGLSENFTIYDSSDSQTALKRVLEEIETPTDRFTPQQIQSHISWAKNNLITAEDYQPRPGSPVGAIVAKVYPAYQARLLASSAVDFDDLLLHVASMLRQNPELRASLDARFRYIMVDEYQDTNLAQYAIVRALSLDYPNLAVTGDPDQSIYGWRGANLNNILEFENDYPDVNVVRLEQNYRSTKRILQVAGQLIAHNRRRKEKDLFTENGDGAPVRYVAYATQKDEAEGIADEIAALVRTGQRRPRDFAIFYRVNALSRAIEFALREHGVPYQVVKGLEFFQRKEIKDVLAYLSLVMNPRNDVAFLRVINVPPRGIGKTTIDRLRHFAGERGVPLLEAARQSGMIGNLPKRAAVAVARFVGMIDRWSLLSGEPVEEVLGHVLADSGYKEALATSKDDEDQERLANIEELLTVAREFDERSASEGQLETFLEEMCLTGDTDGWEAENDCVTLMTLHASKGLEFPAVYIVAVEQGLIPHERSDKTPDDLEEERRLLFVGLTRAQERLQISQARMREFRGQRKFSIPSAFLMELPLDAMDVIEQTPDYSLSGPWTNDDEFADAGWDEPEWQPESPVSEPTAAPPTASAPRFAGVALQTAAELEAGAGQPRPAISSEVFHQGMVVRHPEYGLGKIVALSGSGPRRTATVQFATCGEKKFVLAQSALYPVRNA